MWKYGANLIQKMCSITCNITLYFGYMKVKKRTLKMVTFLMCNLCVTIILEFLSSRIGGWGKGGETHNQYSLVLRRSS